MSDDHYASAVEAFVGQQNGGDLTAHVVYEFVKALNADNRSRHEETMASIANLTTIVGGRAEAIERAKAEVITEIESREHWPVLDKAIAEMCAKLDACSPRRTTDAEGADWTGKRPRLMPTGEDEELGDMRRGWRVGRWILIAVLVPLFMLVVDTLGRYLSHTFFGYPS